MQEQFRNERKAPYAPVSALRDFFTKIQNASPPSKVDRGYLQRLGVASNNEWALLSALKYLGVVDAHGNPTLFYRRLQTTEGFTGALRDLVERAYEPLFKVGGLAKSEDALVDYFRITSSASQAKNAARFFRDVCALAELERDRDVHLHQGSGPGHFHESAELTSTPGTETNGLSSLESSQPAATQILRIKSVLLEKLPTCRPDWSSREYDAICGHFVAMLRSLDSALLAGRTADPPL